MTAGRPGPRADDLRRLIETRHAAFRAELEAVERSPGRDAIHRTRVAARSLRSLLATLKPLLRPSMLARARRDLRNMAAELGDVREADVRRAWLADLAQDSQALSPGACRALVEELERDRDASRKRLRRHLQSQSCRERIARLAVTLGDRRFVTGRRDAGGILARRLRKRWKRLQRALEARSEDPEALHELRLAAKHARYASEALMPLLGIEDGKAFKALKRLQDCLGEHRDATEALAWLANLGEPLGPVLLGRLEDPIGRVRSRRLRELDRLAARFTIPRLAPRAATPGRRRAAGRSARSSVPPRRRSPSS